MRLWQFQALSLVATAWLVCCGTASGEERSWAKLPTVPEQGALVGVATPFYPVALPDLQDTAVSPSDRPGPVEGEQNTELPQTLIEPSHAEDSVAQGLTLEELQSYALAAHPSIQRVQALVQAAQGQAIQVGLKPNPQVGIDFQQLGSGGQAEQYGVAVEQLVVRRQKLQLNRSIGMHEVQRLQQDLVAEQRRVLTDVHITYWRVLRAQREIDVARELLQILQRGVEQTQQLLAANEVAKTDVWQAELEASTAALKLKEAENRHIAAWRSLEAAAGQQTLTVQPLAGDLFEIRDKIEFAEALAILRNQSPEVAALVASIERARCNLRRQQIEPRPDVLVRGLINWRDNGIGGDADAGLAVSVPLPVHDRNQGAIQRARYELVAAERELDQMELVLADRLSPVYLAYANARQRVETFREQVIPKAVQTFELVREAYRAGESAYDSLLIAQRTYAEIRLSYLESLETLHVAETQIDGMLLTNSLR